MPTSWPFVSCAGRLVCRESAWTRNCARQVSVGTKIKENRTLHAGNYPGAGIIYDAPLRVSNRMTSNAARNSLAPPSLVKFHPGRIRSHANRLRLLPTRMFLLDNTAP